MKILLYTLVAASLLLAAPHNSLAGIYKYRDANGRLTFVDEEHKVPAQFREDMTSISEPAAPASSGNKREDEKESRQENLSEPGNSTQGDKAEAKAKLRKYQTAVRINGNRVLVPVAVAMGNRTVKLSLLLDTGATTTVLHRESLKELDLPSGKRYKARVAGGGTVMSEKIKFRQISIGPFKQKKAAAMVINLQGRELPFDGMLGMDFLKTHPYQIDFDNAVINWEPLD